MKYGKGLMTLECHSKGNTDYSPFFCSVSSFGQTRSIENHYHSAKVFSMIKDDGSIELKSPVDWRDAKHMKDSLRFGEQCNWRIGGELFPVRLDATGDFSYALDDFGVQYYCMLWHQHLKLKPFKVENLKWYDAFNDPFAGKFPFCQARVMYLVRYKGLEALEERFQELLGRVKESVAERKMWIDRKAAITNI